MTIQHLTLAQVKEAGRKAYEAKLLTAQHPDPDQRRCEYTIGECHCVIGAALSPSTLDLIMAKDANEATSVSNLRQQQIITFDDAEADALRCLQVLHDNWATASQADDDGAAEINRDLFLKELNS